MKTHLYMACVHGVWHGRLGRFQLTPRPVEPGPAPPVNCILAVKIAWASFLTFSLIDQRWNDDGLKALFLCQSLSSMPISTASRI
ncbi:MAG: hypothetical protein ACE5IR_06880 [bacterium]